MMLILASVDQICFQCSLHAKKIPTSGLGCKFELDYLTFEVRTFLSSFQLP